MLAAVSSVSSPPIGASDPQASSGWRWFVVLSSVVGAAALSYHGYRRTKSVTGAVGWGLLGAIFPVNLIAGGVAAAQLAAEKKGSSR